MEPNARGRNVGDSQVPDPIPKLDPQIKPKELVISSIYKKAIKGLSPEPDTDSEKGSSLEKGTESLSESTSEDSLSEGVSVESPIQPQYQIDYGIYQSNAYLPPSYFEDQTNFIVEETVAKITQAIDTNSVIPFFDELLEDLGKERYDLARVQHSIKQHLFGRLRTAKDAGTFSEWETPLGGQYEGYGEKIRHSLQEIMKDKGARSQKVMMQEMEIGGLKTRTEISKINEKSYVSETVVIKGKEEYPLSSVMISGHTDFLPSFIHSTKDQLLSLKGLLAKSFEASLNSTDEESLKQNVATFRYLFAHACPYIRGSAAISEWIEKAIYVQQKYEFTYTSGSADLDAMTSLSLSEFVDTYVSKAILTSQR